MTRTSSSFAMLGCTALLASLAAYGCGSSSTINPGTGGTVGGVAGHTGAGGGAVIVGTGGTLGGTGGTPVVGGTGGRPATDAGNPPPPTDAGGPVDAGAAMCAPNTMCTAGFTCSGVCNLGGGRGMGTRDCTCTGGNNNRLACGACMGGDAGVVPPPQDAGPAVDAGPICGNNVMNGRNCVLGTSADCTRNPNGNNSQMCTCVGVPDAGADAAVAARWMCQ
jgi:hypothetical protein